MKIKKLIKKYWLKARILLSILIRKSLFWASDEMYFRIWYWLIMGRVLHLKNPQTFNEKIQFLKLHRCRPEYTVMADKLAVREYVGERIDEDIFPAIYGQWDNFDQVDFTSLPNQFVLKTNHLSGGVLVIPDKSKIDFAQTKQMFDKALSANYYNRSREKPYKDIVPKIYAEELLEDDIVDYKLMCFHGKVRCSFTASERREGLKVTWYDQNWQRMPFERLYPASDVDIPKPFNYDRMVKIAEKLSQGIEFLRVDFYEVGNKVYLSELTFYPGAGMEPFYPYEWDKRLGDWIDLDDQ